MKHFKIHFLLQPWIQVIHYLQETKTDFRIFFLNLA